jgi:hypothetical protein
MKIVLLLVILFISLSHWMAWANPQQNKANGKLNPTAQKHIDSSVSKVPNLGFTLIRKIP